MSCISVFHLSSSKCAHVCFCLLHWKFWMAGTVYSPPVLVNILCLQVIAFRSLLWKVATRRQHFFVPSSGCPSIRASPALGLWITGRVPGEAAWAPVVTSLLYSIHLCVVGVEIFMLQIYITLRMFRFFSQIESWVLIRPPLVVHSLLIICFVEIDCIFHPELLIYAFPVSFLCGNHNFDFQVSDSVYVFPVGSWVCLCNLHI